MRAPTPSRPTRRCSPRSSARRGPPFRRRRPRRSLRARAEDAARREPLPPGSGRLRARRSPRRITRRGSLLLDKGRHPMAMRPTVARAIGDRLRAAGVRYVFGHPGGEVIDLIEGFRQAGLEFVLTKHETAAGFMAETTASSTGGTGVCLGTLGPGATNLVTGVAHAYLDRGAVLAFSGQLPAARFAIPTHQRLGPRALFGPRPD